MNDREALAAALEHIPTNLGHADYAALYPIFTAARRQLPLIPETCGTCGGSGNEYERVGAWHEMTHPCPSCHGRGTVYRAETVALVMSAGITLEKAVAVLDALNTEPL